MPLPYPYSTIWYVEASNADGSGMQMGSAVAIWLRKKNDATLGRRYLLTCGHVVRSNSYGAILKNIYAWGPDGAYSPNQRMSAKVALEVREIDEGALSQAARQNPIEDWVVLELTDSQASSGMEAATEVASPGDGDFRVLGYPGGTASFTKGNVKPIQSANLRFRDEQMGAIRFVGTETRPGMSGGGVFDICNRLVGVHRSRNDPTIECHAISVRTIIDQLEAAGFETVMLRRRHNSSMHAALTLFRICALLLLILVVYLLLPYPPPVSPSKSLSNHLTGPVESFVSAHVDLKWKDEVHENEHGLAEQDWKSNSSGFASLPTDAAEVEFASTLLDHSPDYVNVNMTLTIPLSGKFNGVGTGKKLGDKFTFATSYTCEFKADGTAQLKLTPDGRTVSGVELPTWEVSIPKLDLKLAKTDDYGLFWLSKSPNTVAEIFKEPLQSVLEEQMRRDVLDKLNELLKQRLMSFRDLPLNR